MSEQGQERDSLETKLKDRLETLKHSQAMAADQIHPHMDPETELLIEVGSVGAEAQIEYIESLLADNTKGNTEDVVRWDDSTSPEWVGEKPTNYGEIRDSFGLALQAEGLEEDLINKVIATVDDAVVANEDCLEWPSDDTETVENSESQQTFEIDIVWANGSGTDTNVVEFSSAPHGTLIVEYDDGEVERYPYGDVVGARIETDRSESEGIEDLVTLDDHTIHIADPGYPEEYFVIEPSAVPTSDYWDAMVLDYYYGRPVLYLREPGKEDPQFVIALPTEEDPKIRPIHIRDMTNDKNAKILKKGRPVA